MDKHPRVWARELADPLLDPERDNYARSYAEAADQYNKLASAIRIAGVPKDLRTAFGHNHGGHDIMRAVETLREMADELLNGWVNVELVRRLYVQAGRLAEKEGA